MQGKWILSKYIYENSEIELIEDSNPDPTLYTNWLQVKKISQLKYKDSIGLAIEITDDSFNETSNDFTELTYDHEGIQVNDYKGMSGKIFKFKNSIYLKPNNVYDWATPKGDKSYMRFDDGETQISDLIECKDNNLHRYISVVTDGYCLDRISLIYSKA